MGLDSTLYKETHLWNFGEDKFSVSVAKNGTPLKINEDKVVNITEEVQYWRKQNAIHNYFVEHCAEGVDECQRIDVTTEDLLELLNRCKRILADKNNIHYETVKYTDFKGQEQTEIERSLIDHSLAEELLPTRSGFFFGDTEYGEWYITGLETTIKALENELNTPKDNSIYTNYYYQASW